MINASLPDDWNLDIMIYILNLAIEIKTSIVGEDLIWSGRLFQSHGAATEKTQPPLERDLGSVQSRIFE